MRLNIFTTLLFVLMLTFAGCGGGGGGTAGTVTSDENVTVPAVPSDENVTETNASARPLIIIRIEFNDYQFSSSATTWSQKIFGTSEGQLNHYFNEISYGKFQFLAANETDGTNNDGIITVRLDEKHPGLLEEKIDILRDAAVLADASINFAQYDTDKNGVISSDELQIMFLVAGGERATGAEPGIWAHAWCMSRLDNGVVAPTLDNVKLMSCSDNGVYSAFGEKHFDADIGNDATIGVIAHELGHAVFELPDLYDTDESSSGIGNFGLMGGGSWGYKEQDIDPGATPVHMTGWSKVYSGFVTPTVITVNMNNLNINATLSTKYELFKISTGQIGEYFLLENRALSGYDRGLYSLQGVGSFEGGLSVLHIDYNLLSTCLNDNNCNNNEAHKLVDVEEANNPGLDNNATYEGHYNNLFFSGNQDDFTSSTTPNSKRYDGQDSGVSLTNISIPGTTMHLDIEIN